MREIHLTLDRYLNGLRCSKLMFLNEFNRELGNDNDPEELDGNMNYTFRNIATDLLAPKAVDLFCLPDETEYNLKLKKGRTIKEGAFKTKSGDEAWVDLVFRSGSSLHLMSFSRGTALTDVDYYAAAYQYYCCKDAGFEVNKMSIVYVNKDYVKQGDYTIDLLKIKDVTKAVVAMQEKTNRNVAHLRKMLKNSVAPDVQIGQKCLNPYTCVFKKFCWETPSDSIFHLRSLSLNKKFHYYYKGIENMRQLSVNKAEKLTDDQMLEITCTLNNSVAVQHDKLEAWIEELKGPMLFFLSIQSFSEAVPLYDGVKANENMPFLYSLHYLMGDEIDDRSFISLHHCDYLSDPGPEDSRKKFAEKLSAHASLISLGKVIVFNRENEEARLNELIALYPEYKPMLSTIKERLVDLFEVFRERWYYHPSFRDTLSLKNILMALCPGFTYADLDIQSPHEAAHNYLAINNGFSSVICNYYEALRAYSERNTLAMLKIVQFFERLTNKTIIQTNF